MKEGRVKLVSSRVQLGPSSRRQYSRQWERQKRTKLALSEFKTFKDDDIAGMITREIEADPSGVGFGFGGCEPGTLHAHGKLHEVSARSRGGRRPRDPLTLHSHPCTAFLAQLALPHSPPFSAAPPLHRPDDVPCAGERTHLPLCSPRFTRSRTRSRSRARTFCTCGCDTRR